MSQSAISHIGNSRLFLWPKGADTARVRAVVESLSLPHVVRPFWYTAGESEGVERVLVLADGFENGPVVDYIHPRSEANLKESVEWALGLREESRGARLAMGTMKRIFGEDLVWSDVSMADGWSDVSGD